MATHKSAEKRARQSLRKRARNKSTKSGVKTWEKKLRVAVLNKDQKAAQELLSSFMSKIGKAAQKGVVKANTASRKVSRLSALVTSTFTGK